MSNVFKISDSRFGEFEAKIAKLNRRAVKLGCPETTYKVIGTETRFENERGQEVPDPALNVGIRWNDEEPVFTFLRTRMVVEMTGVAPSYDGWEFLGKIEKLPTGNVLSAVPGKEIPVAYNSAEPACDHCKTRRSRKFTYIVAKGEEVKQVGHQCIRDFLGHQSPEHIAAMCELVLSMKDAGEEFGGWGGRSDGLPTQGLVAMSVAVARKFGWKPKMAECSTKDMVMTQIFGRKDLKREDRITPSESDVALASTIIEWIKNVSDDSQFLTNLKVVCAESVVRSRHFGLVVASYVAYDKVVGDPLKFKAEGSDVKNEHFGVVGARDTYDLTVVEARQIEGSFGTTTIVKFLDADKRLAVWFASGAREFEVGTAVKAKATVKKHDQYKGLCQTILTRVSVLDAPRLEVAS